MKTIRTLIPTFLGILSLIGLIELQDFIYYYQEPLADRGHVENEILYMLFIPIGMIALFFQSVIVLPILDKIKDGRKVLGMTLLQIAVIFCLFSGCCFGFIFWTPEFGIEDLLQSSLIGIIVSTFYWTINLLTVKIIDRLSYRS